MGRLRRCMFLSIPIPHSGAERQFSGVWSCNSGSRKLLRSVRCVNLKGPTWRDAVVIDGKMRCARRSISRRRTGAPPSSRRCGCTRETFCLRQERVSCASKPMARTLGLGEWDKLGKSCNFSVVRQHLDPARLALPPLATCTPVRTPPPSPALPWILERLIYVPDDLKRAAVSRPSFSSEQRPCSRRLSARIAWLIFRRPFRPLAFSSRAEPGRVRTHRRV